MTNVEALDFLKLQRDFGNIWVNTQTAAEILGCLPASLTNAANKKGTLGSLEYFWAGNNLKISVMSLIKFVAGGYPLRDVFGEG